MAELHFFGYGSLTAPHVTYHRADATGSLDVSRGVDVPGLTMMHAFAMTSSHVIFLDQPVFSDLELALKSLDGAPVIPYRWSVVGVAS